MEFRPCIDIHNGKVKQIVGSSLKDIGNVAEENFVSTQDGAFYAHLYKEHYSGQPYLPEEVRGSRLYEPSENGCEQQIRERLYRLTGDGRYRTAEDLLDRDPKNRNE